MEGFFGRNQRMGSSPCAFQGERGVEKRHEDIEDEGLFCFTLDLMSERTCTHDIPRLTLSAFVGCDCKVYVLYKKQSLGPANMS